MLKRKYISIIYNIDNLTSEKVTRKLIFNKE